MNLQTKGNSNNDNHNKEMGGQAIDIFSSAHSQKYCTALKEGGNRAALAHFVVISLDSIHRSVVERSIL